jgi:hypothetical protein
MDDALSGKKYAPNPPQMVVEVHQGTDLTITYFRVYNYFCAEKRHGGLQVQRKWLLD